MKICHFHQDFLGIGSCSFFLVHFFLISCVKIVIQQLKAWSILIQKDCVREWINLDKTAYWSWIIFVLYVCCLGIANDYLPRMLTYSIGLHRPSPMYVRISKSLKFPLAWSRPSIPLTGKLHVALQWVDFAFKLTIWGWLILYRLKFGDFSFTGAFVFNGCFLNGSSSLLDLLKDSTSVQAAATSGTMSQYTLSKLLSSSL